MRKVVLVFGLLVFVCSVSAEPPAGYYDPASGKTGFALKSALHDIIDDHTDLGYNSAKDAMWGSIDNVDGYVKCRYIAEWRYTSVRDTLGTNTEHTWPQSLGADVSPKRSDIHHLFITDETMNSRRGNLPFGTVTNPDYQQGGTKIDYNNKVEPRSDFKGDVARALMYMDVRYTEMELVNTGESIDDNEMGYLDELLRWHVQDPVSEEEQDRNDAIYNLQHNRNPFIDHPEFVAIVYQGAQWPTETPEPTATETPTPTSTQTPTITPTPERGFLFYTY